MKTPYEIERMSPVRRRRFLKILGAALAAPAVSPAMRYAGLELGGGKAYAQADGQGTIFIEVCLRDQWDQMHVMVPPSIARRTQIVRGETGAAVTFFAQPSELSEHNGVFLTEDSRELADHLDTVAQVDHCEASQGPIHGHEAANAIRSPGRTTDSAGRMPMFENDPATAMAGNVEYYGTVPTPATLHNFYQKQLDSSLRNGFVFKGLSRTNHTVFHFAAGLAGADLDRIRSIDELQETVRAAATNIIPTAQEADALQRVLGRLDSRFMSRRGYAGGTVDAHDTQLSEARASLYSDTPRFLDLTLSEEEREFWSAGVPNQMCTSGDRDSFECEPEKVKAQIWQQFAFAFKVAQSGITRTIALEFDYMDLHDFRPELAVRTQGKQISRSLARLITKLKEAGLYDRTLIAVYTADGSRAPHASSYGSDGKNTLILAGGKVRGGYWGDIELGGDGSGNGATYRPPDPNTGAPSGGFRGIQGRLDSGRVWRTVVEAAGVPRSIASGFGEVASAEPLPFLIRS